MTLKITHPIVSAAWLNDNLAADNLIVLDGTIAKVGQPKASIAVPHQIPNARFFDIENVFSAQQATYPNTILSAEAFQKEAQALGINQDSCIVIYDIHGVYSAPRVWWLFKAFGFNNVAVLDGGLPQWVANHFPLENKSQTLPSYATGNFIANYQSERVYTTDDVLQSVNNASHCIADARGKSRFYPTEPEPRPEVRSGHIPNSKNLPYANLQENGMMKSPQALQQLFTELNTQQQPFVFSCGSGITACILALGLEITGNSAYAVYDGSWSEWGSRHELPIETI